MYTYDTQVRVRYGDTDKMSYVYYGKYAEYFEVGRTELIRSLGAPYKEMEEKGVMLPVVEFTIKYFRPAVYDDLLTVRTTLHEMPSVKFITHCEIFNEAGTLLVSGKVVLAFVDMQTGRVTRAPEYVMEAIRAKWN